MAVAFLGGSRRPSDSDAAGRSRYLESFTIRKGNRMNKDNLPVFVFNTRVEAEDAIRSSSKSGFDVKKLSRVGKGY
jgi:hypothetical protein